MKKFVVLRKIGSFAATVVREFDKPEPAAIFCSLLASSELNEFTKYFTAEVNLPNEDTCGTALAE